MSFRSFFCGASVGSVAGASLLGGVGAALGTASGATGAAVLDAAGHAGYAVKEAAQMGAVGGAILNGTTGLVVGGVAGGLAAMGLFGQNKSDDDKSRNGSTICSVISYTASMTLSGLVGYGIMNSGDLATTMDLGRAAASLAVGGAITAIPASCALVCIAIPLVVSAAACCILANQNEQNNEAELATRPRMGMSV